MSACVRACIRACVLVCHRGGYFKLTAPSV